ncbi:hypothetical protein DFH06DRAFT_1096143 [Mycena polygramma]|nr:hypothetical protein DFH06DRAFT_1096143 [Mycena polygramma]
MQSNSGPTACDACGKPPFKDSPLLPNASQISELRDILRSNTLPLEKSSFLGVVGGASLALERYDTEIERLQQRLSVLMSDRAKLQSYSDGCRSAFSPIRRLPPELLAEIFGMCDPPGERVLSNNIAPTKEINRLAKKYLLQLSRVCFHWHGVAMETPMLWSTIIFDQTLWSSCSRSSKTLFDLVETSLERGADYPLTIRAAVGRGNPAERSILELLGQHSHRWKHVYLRVDTRCFPFLANARGRFPLLETLRLINSSSVNHLPYIEDIFESAPKLRVVFLGDWHPTPLRLPWNTLRSFMYRIEPWLDPSGGQTTLGTLLESMNCSRLADLRFIRSKSGAPCRWNQPCFLGFVSRSSLHMTLRILQIDAALEDHELLQCLAVLPLLEVLYISDSKNRHPTITDNLLQQLVWRPDQPCLVPHLDILRLTSLVHFSDDALRDLILSRTLAARSDYAFSLKSISFRVGSVHSPQSSSRRSRNWKTLGIFRSQSSAQKHSNTLATGARSRSSPQFVFPTAESTRV